MAWTIKYKTPVKTVKQGDQEYKVTREEYAARYNATIPEEPEIPEEGQHLWDWFWVLSERRQKGFDSANPITFSEIKAWVDVTGVIVLPEEVEVLIIMDTAYLKAISQEQDARRQETK